MTLKIDTDSCVGCGSCAEVCPVNVWEIKNGKAVLVKPEDCVECGACVDNCPVQCLSLD